MRMPSFRNFTIKAAIIIATITGFSLSASAQPAAAKRNDVQTGQLKARATITCIGLMWPLEGDANANASATVEYRRAGDAQWRKALPLRRCPERKKKSKVKFMKDIYNWYNPFRRYAVKRFLKNYLAGSLFYLKGGTKYEVKVALTDPDGGSVTRTVTVTTRTVPTIPADGNVIEVRGGGDALKKAVAKAKAGDIFNVHAGTYNGGILISASGTPDKPICIRDAEDGKVLIHGGEKKNVRGMGIRVRGSHVRIKGLSLYNFKHCIHGDRSANDLAVWRCRMEYFYTAVQVMGDDGYYADNTIRLSYNTILKTDKAHIHKEGHGIEILHRDSLGNVVCYNDISLVGDAVVLICGESDVYGNDVIYGLDDALETDEGYPNLRIMDNRWSYTGQNGISFQPYIGGPAYLIRNLLVGFKECAIKNRYESENVILINNTFVSRDGYATAIPLNVYARNNLFVTNPGAKGFRSMTFDAEPLAGLRLDLDYNGYTGQGPNSMGNLDGMHKLGMEKHGVMLGETADVIANPLPALADYDSPQWIYPKKYLTDKTRPHPDLSIKANSAAIDAGVIVPNITESFHGKAPDLGALEFGLPIPHYGVRPVSGPKDTMKKQIVEACIIGTHAYQIQLHLKRKRQAKSFRLPEGFTPQQITKLVELHNKLISADPKEVRAWSESRKSTFKPGPLVKALLDSHLPLPEKLPVRVAAEILAQKSPRTPRVKIDALANLLQIVLEVNRDGGVLQDSFRLYNAMGLLIGPCDLGIADDNNAFALLGGQLARACKPASVFKTNVPAWQIALRKIQNWGLKYRGEIGPDQFAEEVLKHKDIQAVLTKIKAVKPMSILVLGHSYTMSSHWSSQSSFTGTAEAIFKKVNPKVTFTHMGVGGMSASTAKKRFFAKGLEMKPDMVLFVMTMGGRNIDAFEEMVAEFHQQGAVTVCLDRVHPQPKGWLNPPSRKRLDEIADKYDLKILEVGKLVDHRGNRDNFVALDGVHARPAYHKLLAGELVKFIAGVRQASLPR